MISRFTRNTNRIPAYAAGLLLMYMPFHVFISQSLSTLTGGLNIWKIAKDIFLILAVLLTIFLVWKHQKQTRVYNILLIGSVLYSIVHLLIWAMNSDICRQTALLGTLYNTRVVWFAVLGTGASLLAPGYLIESKIIKLVIGVGLVVAILGLLQYLLPNDILTHFGYSVERGVKPSFLIDNKPDLPRIMSTLRDPNSLAAYLIIPICLTVSQLVKNIRNRLIFSGILLVQLLALFLSFSRGGAVGLVVALSVMAILQYRKWILKHASPLFLGLLVAIVLAGTFSYLHRDQYVIQNIILHSDENTVGVEDSNDLHVRLSKEGATAVLSDPFGHGPGTAGAVSIHIPNGGFITENYYIQIAYEVGIIGLIVFLGIWGYLMYRIQKNRGTLATVLLASAAAYAVLGLIMHIWINEAVAAQWWILGGIISGTKNIINEK